MEQLAKLYLLLERMRETVYCSTFQAVALLTFLPYFVYSMLRQKWGSRGLCVQVNGVQ